MLLGPGRRSGCRPYMGRSLPEGRAKNGTPLPTHTLPHTHSIPSLLSGDCLLSHSGGPNSPEKQMSSYWVSKGFLITGQLQILDQRI